MKKILMVLIALMSLTSASAQGFTSTKNDYTKLASVVTFGRAYSACSMGEAVLYKNNKTNGYQIRFGTDNRFDDIMILDFDSKEELIKTLSDLENVFKQNEKGNYVFPDGRSAYIRKRGGGFTLLGIGVTMKGFAGEGLLRGFEKFIKAASKSN